MKNVMLILFFSISFSLSSSFNSPICETEAEIYGFDITRCGCCGGWIVYIVGERYLSKTKILEWEYPPSLAFTNKILISGDTLECPIKVRIDYSHSNRCRDIDIHCIEIIESK